MSRFIGSRPMSQYDLYQQQRGDALLRQGWEQDQIAAERRDAMRANAAALANSVGRDNADRDQQMRMLAMQQGFAADQAQAARDWEYQTATNPELRRSRMNEHNMLANADADRQANLMRSQGDVNAFVNTERMQDQRVLDLNKGVIDSALTAQRGNIDARLQAFQGQQVVDRDKVKSGLAMDEDAYTRMQNRKAALMDMENQERQAGVQLPDNDQKRRDALWEEYGRIEDEMSKPGSVITPRQALMRQDQITRQLGQLRATIKPVPLQERFANERVKDPDGTSWTINPKTGGWDSHLPPPGLKPEQTDPRAMELKQKEFELKLNKAIADEVGKRHGASLGKGDLETIENQVRKTFGLAPVEKPSDQGQTGSDPQELFRHVQTVNRMAAQAGVPVQQYVEGLAERQPEAAQAYLDGVQMIRQAQGQGQPDPRAGGVPPVTPPPQQQRMVPGQPGPVDPRMLMMQGQPAQAPAAQRPFVGAAPQRQAAPQQQAPAPVQQQASAAIQVFNVIKSKYGGKLPPKGSQDEADYIQAATFLHNAGIDPNGNSKRQAENEGHMSRYGAWNK